MQLSPIFAKNKFLMGDEFTMLDVMMAPLLWRLGYYGIDLPKSAAPFSSMLKASSPVRPSSLR